ncbi:MAG: GTPase Era [Defluviitaleaceae bacterium]|nr:GTPase Era [Defluviitaleaceae bacterium]MCL2239117.1 GTPase Era [Defluviitaleaceae bacterium]
MNAFHSGFVTIIGRPNVGKSTLMNHFIGEKISIVTSKPQTTRNKIRSILTGADYQIIFIDTPGLHTPKTKLGSFMVRSALNTLSEVDAVVLMVEPKSKTGKIHEGDQAILDKLAKVKTPVFLAINKTDKVAKPELLTMIDRYSQAYTFKEIIPISALTGDNTPALLTALRGVLPAGPRYFPEDQITDQPERQITAEIIREKALTFLQEEIPHGVAVEITQFKEGRTISIGATIFCERDSHKAIIIGKQGAMLKRIGQAARRDMEALLGAHVFLELWVKVKKNWRDNDFLLRNFGFLPDI